MKGDFLNEETRIRILNICQDLAKSREIIAACLYRLQANGPTERKRRLNAQVVIKSPQPVFELNRKRIDDLFAEFLVVDQRTFESDVEKGWLGELVVENIITPYRALLNEEYLWDQEVKAKKRLVSELIDNLVMEFPELSYDLFVRPEYFMFETISRISSLFPPMAYGFLNLLEKDLRERNIESTMKGFNAALTQLAAQGHIDFFDRYVKIKKGYIDSIKARKPVRIDLFGSIRRGAVRRIFRMFPKTLLPLMKDEEISVERSIDLKGVGGELLSRFEDPKRYLYVPTPLGFVALSDKTTIEDFVRRAVPQGRTAEMNIKKIGGVLNSVYLLAFHGEQRKQKIVVKLFKDWYGWKWFPLSLWAFGTRGFSVLGKSRLEKEYAINRFLSSQGISVPNIIFVSPKEHLIFEELVEGQNLVDILKRFSSGESDAEEIKRSIRDVGRAVAQVHKVGVALGDCKPENIIIAPNGKVWFVDLEQAERGGDQIWDIAEFLFYTGHYFPLSISAEEVKIITCEFLKGYLEVGGSVEKTRKICSPKYLKVFALFAPPHILIAICNTCKKVLIEEPVISRG